MLYFILLGVTLFAPPGMQSVGLPTLAGFTLIALYIRTPVTIVIDSYPLFKRADAALEKVEELGRALGDAPRAGHEAAPAKPRAGWERIDLVGVTHDERYYALADRIVRLDEGKLDYERALTLTRQKPLELPGVY